MTEETKDTNDVNLDITKQYVTRDGRPVHDLHIKYVEKKARLILGTYGESHAPCSWTLAGMYYTENKVSHHLDLVPVVVLE